ncbi:MAG: metal ABC transporter substrate-binding protein [Bdellovibrionales bacterium]
MRCLLFCSAIFMSSTSVFAETSLVATTTTDIQSLVSTLAPFLKVQSFTDAKQDPHHIDIKPSHVVVAQKAKLVVAIGLGYEEWLKKLKVDQKKIFLLGPLMNPETDPLLSHKNHPEGNPHLFLDPQRVADVITPLSLKLIEVFPEQGMEIKKRAQEFQSQLLKQLALWKTQLNPLKGKKVITYHTTFYYFLKRFGIDTRAVLESHPGQAPSPQHLAAVLSMIKKENIDLFLIENIFSLKNLEKLKENHQQLKILVLPTSVGTTPSLKDLPTLYQEIVDSLASR